MKGFVFFDLDGTLLNGESKVDASTAEAIQTLKNNGYEPFIATGRSPAETRDIMESANIHSGIFMNGQVVLYRDQRVYSSEIPTETVEKFHQMVKDDGYGLTVYNHEQFYLVEASAGARDAYGFIHSNPPALKEDFYKENPINMMLFISLPPAEKKYKVAFQNLDFLRNTPYSVDVISKGNSKAEGIKRFLEHLNQVDAKTFAFGDGPNDIEMLKAVQHPVAMGNALPILKEIAEFITTDNTDNGIINGFLKKMGWIQEPLDLFYNAFSLNLVMVYAYLPFMILPLYTQLVKLDGRLLEAASDLGARPIKSFFTITLPLSKTGIIAGSMLVFVPAVGEFVIPELVGGSENLMIGKVLWQAFFDQNNWPLASAVAVVMVALLVVPIALFQHYENRELEEGSK